jgi:membrane protein YdbS with pleckstrin-like domain
MSDPSPTRASGWRGRPSQWLIAWHWVLAIAVVAAVGYGFFEREALAALVGKVGVPDPGRVLAWAGLGVVAVAALNLLVRALTVRAIEYRVHDGVLEVERGLLSRRTDLLELFRVRDIASERPFLMRLVGLGNVVLLSNDLSSPSLTIAAVGDVAGLMQSLRDEINRARGRVRMTEVEGDLQR